MRQWQVSKSGRILGPFTDSQLKHLAQTGKLSPADLVRHDGLQEWVPCGRIRALFGGQASAAPPSASPARASVPPPLPTSAAPNPPRVTGPPDLPAPAGMAGSAEIFGQRAFTVRRKVFRLFGGAFHIYDGSGAVVGFSKQKAFKLKEDIRVFNDETMTRELLVIKARNILDFSATYDVFAPGATRSLGSLRRKGLKSSFIRDEWLIFGPGDAEIAIIRERNAGLALLRRFINIVNLIIPQQYEVVSGGKAVASLHTNRNPFVYKLRVTCEADAHGHVPPALVLAGSILLAAVEGKQGW